MTKFRKYRNHMLAATLALPALLVAEKASAVATLADIGVDLADYVPLMVTAIGATVAVIVGAWAAFKLLKITFNWAGKMGG